MYGDPDGLDRPWSLDLIPLLIPSEQWDRLSEGLIQRARLLDRLLADLYGPAETVQKGAACHRSCSGLIPAFCGRATPCGSGEPLAASLCGGHGARGRRGISGAQRSHAGAFGSGLLTRKSDRPIAHAAVGISAVQCGTAGVLLFVDCGPRSRRLRPANHDNPHVVLLTPGPYNETYFEHSYLARYLGYPLVQGNDLTVRDANVYVKTLEGLRACGRDPAARG